MQLPRDVLVGHDDFHYAPIPYCGRSVQRAVQTGLLSCKAHLRGASRGHVFISKGIKPKMLVGFSFDPAFKVHLFSQIH